MKNWIAFTLVFLLAAGALAAGSASLYAPKTPGKGVVAVFPDVTSYQEFKTSLARVYDFYKQEQGVGLLGISSAPDGAAVHLDGVYRGTTPLGANASVGAYSVRLRKPGYADYDTAVAVLPGTEKNLHVDLRNLNPTGAAFPLPVDELSRAVYPRGGFQAELLIRDKKGDLYLVYLVEHYSNAPYVYTVTEIGADGKIRTDERKNSGYLRDMGLAVSRDHGKTWTFIGAFRQPEYGGSDTTRTIRETYLTGTDSEGNSYEVIRQRVEHTVSVFKGSFLMHEGTIPLDAGIRLLYHSGTLESRNEVKVTVDYDYTFDFKGRPVLKDRTYSYDFKEPVTTGSENRLAYVSESRSSVHTSVPVPPGTNPLNNTVRLLGGAVGKYYFFQPTKPPGKPRLLSSSDLSSFAVEFDLEHSYTTMRLDHQTVPYFLDWQNQFFVREGGSFSSRGKAHPGYSSTLSMEFDGQGNLHTSFVNTRSSVNELYYQYVPVAKHLRQAVYLFTQSNCGKCDLIKTYLSEARVSFKENPSDLDASLQRSVKEHLDTSGRPLLVVQRSDSEYRFITRTDAIGLDHELGISKPRLVATYPKGYGIGWARLFLDVKGNPLIVAASGTDFRLYSFDSGTWTEKSLFSPTYGSGYYNRYPLVFAENQYLQQDLPYNKMIDSDDVHLLVPVGSSTEKVGSPSEPWLQVQKTSYTAFTTRIKEDASGEFSFDQVLAAPSVPATAIIAQGKPFVYTGTVGSKASIIEFSADQETFLVAREADCANRPNCLVFDTASGSIAARIRRGAHVRVDDSFNAALQKIDVQPIAGSGQLVLVQGNVLGDSKPIRLKFSEDGITYRGDATALTAELDLSGTDYPQEKQKFRNLLTKKAYLIMRNKQMVYGVGQKKPPFVTEFELLYLLEEAEKVAETVYGPDYASAVQISKSQWLKAYADKDTSDVGLNPFASLVAGGSTFTGVPVLRLPLVDSYVPGWYEDRDGDLINFAHIYAVAGFGDLAESDVRNAWRTLGYSYLGDRGFSYAYLGSYFACLFVCPSVTETALQNAIGEAPSDELIADFYALDLRTSFRHSSSRMSAILKSYFDSDQQERAKIRALTEAQVFGYILGG